MADIALPPVAPSPAAAAASLAAATVARLPAELAGMAAGTIIQGVVIGREPGGQTVLRTQYGALVLKGGALPMGGTVTLQLQSTGTQIQVVILSVTGGTSAPAETRSGPGAPAAAAPAPTSAGRDALFMLAEKWPALDEALEALRRAAPSAAQHLADDVVPHPGPELAAKILSLIAALHRGDIALWLGDEARHAIESSGRDGLASRLADDFGRMSRLAGGEPGSEWRGVPLPILDQGALGQVRMFYRGRRHGGAAEDDPGTRLLIDVELSRLGAIQLDGLAQPRRFDLIVRTRSALPATMRDDIAAIFDEARAIGGLAGEIAFITTRDFVAPPVAPGADGLGLTA